MKHIFNIRRGGAPLLGALALAVLPLTGCDGLLEVEDLDVTSVDSFVDEASIPALRATVRNDFVGAYEGLILYTGLLGDEWVSSGTFGTRIEVDRRDIDVTNATVEGLFSGISRVRAIGEFVNARFDVVDTAGEATTERAEVRALSGLALVLMGETYCNGTPISNFIYDEDQFVYGAPRTNQEVWELSETWFQSALDVAAAGSDQEYLARVGLGRALVNQGEYQAAAAVVADVPTDFVFLAEHDAQPGQNNPIWSNNISQERWSASNAEGGVGLPYLAETDPRMPWRRSPANDVGFDRRTPQFDALKYSARPAFTVIADGVEARLIEAEAALEASGGVAMVTILNDLRNDVETLMPQRIWDYANVMPISNSDETLAPLLVPATFDEQVDLLFEERAYWLWLTSHRLGDMRRLIRQYERAADDVFPTGLYAPHGNAKGGSYGDDVNFPIPAPEANNPETDAGQCLDRNA